MERELYAINANILLDPLLFASSVFFKNQQLLLSASENTILVPPQRTAYIPSIGESLLELTNPSFQFALLRIERTQKEEQYSTLPSSLKFSWVSLVNMFPLPLFHLLTSIVRTLPSKILSVSFTSSSVFSIPSLFTSCVTSFSISQSMSSSITTPAIISFSTQPISPSAA